VFPLRTPPPAETVGIDPRGLHLAFRALATSPEHSHNPRKGGRQSRRIPTSFLLSWPCPLVAPPSCHAGASTPGHRCKQRWPSGRGFHTSTPVPPAWSLTTSTVCSAPEPAGLLRPASDLGVRRVSYPRVPRLRRDGGDPRGLPRSAVIPFKGFPSSAAVPHHCSRCPLAVAAYPNTPD
jgi:hypothetical protein